MCKTAVTAIKKLDIAERLECPIRNDDMLSRVYDSIAALDCVLLEPIPTKIKEHPMYLVVKGFLSPILSQDTCTNFFNLVCNNCMVCKRIKQLLGTKFSDDYQQALEEGGTILVMGNGSVQIGYEVKDLFYGELTYTAVQVANLKAQEKE